MPLPILTPSGVPEPQISVLRPELYSRLRKRFGAVRVTNQGMPFVSSLEETQGGHLRRVCNKLISPDHTPGETYRVCCPWCRDTTFRLYIPHMWGKRDERTKSLNLWLAHCFNERCVQDPGQWEVLYGEVFSDCPVEDRNDMVFKGTATLALSPREEPGNIFRLSRMPKDHPAVIYLTKRGYNIDYLEEHFKVGYISDVKDDLLWPYKNKIFIPVFKDGILVGYQARFIGTPPHKGIPKYMTASGFSKGLTLYNLDTAKKYKFTAVLEGATKVWRFGPEATATMGKGFTVTQADLIIENWEKIAIVLDPNARMESQRLFNYVKAARPDTVLVDLPDGIEPDEMSTPNLRRFVFETAAKAGVTLQ